MKSKKRVVVNLVVQRHHISYEPEETVLLFQGEHRILTLMSIYCKKTVSLGFIRALRRFIEENVVRAYEILE